MATIIAIPKERRAGTPGQWLYDRYVGLRVVNRPVGMLIADKPFELDVDMENRTGMELHITQIKVEFGFPEANKMLGLFP